MTNSTLNYSGCFGALTTNAGTSATNSPGCPVIRDTTVWLRHAQLGMVKIGHGSTATDNLILIDLSGAVGAITPDVGLYAGGMILRGKNGQFGGAASFNWTAAIRGHESFDTFRRDHVLYETPSLYGFTLQAAVANDNFWDVALRYAGEFNGIRIAAGIGYLEDTNFNAPFQNFNQAGALCTTNCDVKVKDLKGSASVLHVPTGLFLTGAAGQRELSGSQVGTVATQYTGPDARFWYLAGGVSKNYFGIGNSILFGEYSEHKGGLSQLTFLAGNQAVGAAGNGFCTVLNGVTTNGAASCDNKASVWGLGVAQNIDAASMQVFATYKVYSMDTPQGFSGTSANLNNGVNDFKMFILGTKIEF